MSVIYKFSSLASLADFMGIMATRARERATAKATPVNVARLHVREAATWESAADLVRNSIIEEDKK